MSGILKLAKALGVKLAPQEEALRVAQENAVKMLGLPPGNTPMDRAAAMGFDTPAYHGTNREFEAFSNEMLGAKTGAKSAQKAHFFAASPEVSNTYVSTKHVYPNPWEDNPPVYQQFARNKQAMAEFDAAPTNAEKRMVLEKYGFNRGSGQVMPVMLNMGKSRVVDYKGSPYRETSYNDQIKAAKKGGKDSVVLKNTFDPGPHEGYNQMTDIYAVMEPNRVRSRFAAFDPARINENNLLASRLLPFALPGLLALPQDE